MPRTYFTGSQFKCHKCNWESSFEPEFIEKVRKVRETDHGSGDLERAGKRS